MSDLYPEPPHLSAFVESRLEPSRSLLAGWDVLREADCAFTGEVLVARVDTSFRDVSDVDREVIHHSGGPAGLLAARDPLRMQFRHRSLGTVSLGLASAFEVGERHPLEVAIHAGPLSLPVELWSRQDRQAAKRVLGWTERLLVAMAQRTEALYGAIGIEAVFPTRRALTTATKPSAWRPFTWFWPTTGDGASSDETELLASLNQKAVTREAAGTMFRAWKPAADATVDDDGIDRVVRFLSRTVATPR
jgi:hypothetical protein